MSATDPLVEAIATRVVELLRDRSEGSSRMVSQASSPLGNRRHCLAVRRRIAQDMPGASVVGREYLLTPAALEDELARLTRGSREARRAVGAGRLATL